MKLSIFTPTNDGTGELIPRAYRSILAAVAESTDWEWIIVVNGKDSQIPPRAVIPPNERIKIVEASDLTGNVGALKRRAVEACTGDLLVELDHDDELRPNALARLETLTTVWVSKFPKLVIYSDWIQSRGGADEAFSPAFGWSARPNGDGRIVIEAAPVCARNLCEVYYAPNHVRAFTRAAYDAAGGYRADLPVCDDQALLIQLYLAGARFRNLPGGAYIQHASEKQTQFVRNPEIQAATKVLCRSWTQRLVVEEAKRNGFPCFDLGSALGTCPDGFLGVDERPGAHVTCDAMQFLGSMPDDSIFCLRAHDFLEHIDRRDVVRFMNEVYRVLRPGGWLLSRTPSTDGRGAWQDPTHVSGWNENSFWYYTRKEQAAFVPEIEARFQAVRVETHFPTQWHRDNHIPYVDADLVALKGQHTYGIDPWRGEL